MTKKYKIEITREKGWLLRYWASIYELKISYGVEHWMFVDGSFGFTLEEAKKAAIKSHKETIERRKVIKVINLDTL